MSEIMVVEGKDDEAPRKCTLKMAPGMGLLEGVIIDQHFNQRGRIGRLLAAVAQNPNVLGIGIDEDTAMIVNKELEFSVEGSGVVTIVDGREISFTNISEQYQDDPLAITNVKIHILPRGYGFNLIKKQEIIFRDERKSFFSKTQGGSIVIIVSSHAYQGKNIYSYKPVVKLVVDLGRFADIPTKDIEGFNDAIQELLPGLKKHCCCKGYEGGFVERLKEGTYLAHVMEHIALEFQAKLGYDIRFGKTRETGKKGIYNVIYGYENEYAGLQSGKLAFEVIEGILAGELPEVNAKLKKSKRSALQRISGLSTAAIVREAQQKDIPVI